MSASCRALRVFVASCLVLPLPAVAQTVIATIPVGSLPVALAINSTTNKIFAVNQGSNNVTVIDGVTSGTAVVRVGSYPVALAVNPTTNKIYVANACGSDPACKGNGTVTVIDGVTNGTAVINVGAYPAALAVNPLTNRIYVVNQKSNNVTVIDGASNAILASVGVGYRPQALGVNPSTNKIYVANSGNGTVTVLDGQSNTVAGGVSVGSFPCAVAVNSLTNTIYVANQVRNGTVSVIDGKNDTLTASVVAGNSPVSVAVDPVINTIYAANYGDDTVSVIDGSSNLATATVAVGLSPGPVAVNPVTHAIYAADFYAGTLSVINGTHHSVAPVKVGSNPDAVALNPSSNRVYVANSFDGTVSVIAGANSDPLQFVAVTPCRLVDTRNPNGGFGGPSLQAKSVRNLIIPDNKSCNIPSSAAAYSLNVTVVPQGFLGYLTVWPTGENQPLVSTLNSYDGRVKANAAIVPAGSQGAVSFYVTNTTDLVLDIDGYFAPVSNSTLAFYSLAPCRVADTRNAPGDLGGPFLKGGVPRAFPVLKASSCNIPNTAQAYSLNFTVLPHGFLGHLTVWPTGQQQPLASTLNSYGGQVAANAAIVRAGSGGKVSTFASDDTDLIIDINGYFAPPGQGGGLSLYPVAPCRVLDTRNGSGAFNGTLSPPVDVVASPCGVPSQSQAYVFNATVVPQGFLGFLTLWPDGSSLPNVSTLNAYDGAVSSNMAIVPAGNKGKVDAYAYGLTDLLLDISSYFAR